MVARRDRPEEPGQPHVANEVPAPSYWEQGIWIVGRLTRWWKVSTILAYEVQMLDNLIRVLRLASFSKARSNRKGSDAQHVRGAI